MTDGQLQEMRYGLLFSEIAAQEKMAQSEEDAGNAEAAASWRAHLAKKSGLKPEEAEMVKKIGIQYTRDWWAFQAKYRDTLQAVRKAHPGVRMARLNSPEIAALEREREGLFTNMRAQLIRVLGPRSFTQLDSYTLHSHDNARTLSTAKAHPQTDQPIPVD